MPRPIKLRDLLAALRKADKDLQFLTERGKGSHLVICKDVEGGKRSFTLPTSSGEVLGPYQKKIITLFELPPDTFQK